MNELQMRTWAEISLENIGHNYREMKKALPPGCRFMGVVKANAYGHGAVPVARLLQSLGADYLAVACLSEARELRRAKIKTPILLFGPTPAELVPELIELDLTQAVSDLVSARALSKRALEKGGRLKAHLKLETGMGRLGFCALGGQAGEDAAEALQLPGLDFEGVFTHFAVSDERGGEEFTAKQFELFRSAISALEASSGRGFQIKHCVNTGAMVNFREMSMDMVRPGLALYGHGPEDGNGGFDLRPAMELKTRIAFVTEHKKGETLSYGRSFACPRDMRVAVLPIGYADGLHRVLSNKMDVLVKGKRAKQLGRICMDLCMVDITDIPAAGPFDVVTVFGHDGETFLSVEEQAQKAGTISYEMLCSVSERVPRVYI